MRDAGHEALVEERTGLHINPLFPATKIAWLLDSGEGLRQRARAGELRAGTVNSWLLWNLTAGRRHATDASNASRTLLFRTDTLGWDETLCELFEVPSRMLPDVCASDHAYGKTSLSIGALRKGVPVHAMLGDSHAALFGHGVRRPGFVKATFGTGTSLMALTDRRRKSSHGLSGTIAWKTGDDVAYALEGNISVSAQAIDFIARLLGLEGPQALLELAQSVPTSNGIVFVPALVGLGAPYWSDTARGAIWGLSLDTQPAHVARATLEAIAFQVHDVFRAMEGDVDQEFSGLFADGGAAQSDFLMQLQANTLGLPVFRPQCRQMSGMGAAMFVHRALGGIDFQMNEKVKFEPSIDRATSHNELLSWKDGIARTL